MCSLHANAAREALVRMLHAPLLAGQNVTRALAPVHVRAIGRVAVLAIELVRILRTGLVVARDQMCSAVYVTDSAMTMRSVNSGGPSRTSARLARSA
jgi:hypothetical protein